MRNFDPPKCLDENRTECDAEIWRHQDGTYTHACLRCGWSGSVAKWVEKGSPMETYNALIES